MLAKLTMSRIQKLYIDPTEDFSMEYNPGAYQQEYFKQKKTNDYLTNTLKHLNMTIDILIEQYDPVKIK